MTQPPRRARIPRLYNTRHNEWKRKLQERVKVKKLKPCHWAVLQKNNIQILDDNWNVTHNIRTNQWMKTLSYLQRGHLLTYETYELYTIWDVSNEIPQKLFYTDGIYALKQLSDGRIIFWMADFVNLYNIETKEIKQSHEVVSPIQGFLELSNKQILSHATTFTNYQVLMWNLMDMTSTELVHFPYEIRDIVELPNRRLAILTQLYLCIFGMQTEESRLFWPSNAVGSKHMTNLTRNRLAISDFESVYIFNVDSEAWLNIPNCHPSKLLQLSDGRLAIGCQYGDILIWDLDLHKELMKLNNWAEITSLVESSNNELIVASKDNKVRQWNLETKTSTVLCDGRQVCLLYLPANTKQFLENMKTVLDPHVITDLHGIVQDYV